MSYKQTIDPGIDISHYGAPYKGMFGLDGVGEMLYRYRGLGTWTGAPAADPRIVQRYTVIRATWRVRNVPSDKAQQAADRLLYQGRQAFSGNTVRKIGSTGWTADGRVGYEVILAQDTRAGEIKQKNFQAGTRAQAALRDAGGISNAELYDAQTAIPSNAFTDAPPTAPATPETTPSSTTTGPAPSEGFLTQRVAGLPVWAVGLIGITIVGGVVVVATRRRPAAVTANRRRRSRRRRVLGNARKRKTRDVWEVRGNYGYGHGFETVTAELTLSEARQRLREYRENEPGVPFKIVKTREPL